MTHGPADQALSAQSPARRTAAGPFAGWLRAWAPVLLACLAILIESTRTMGADNTSRWLKPLYESLFGYVDPENWESIHHILRKTGHFLGYGTVSLTWLHAWLWTLGRHPGLKARALRWWATWRALACTALVATADEVHQAFLPNRTGRFADVLLDTCGAAVLCSAVWLLFGWTRNKAARTSA